jgi:hypothetical protein
MKELKTADAYEATGTLVKDPSGLNLKPLGLLVEQEYYIFKFDDANIPSMKLSDIIVAIAVGGGPVKFQAHVVSNHCYTHTRNRESWTGPYFQFRVFNLSGLLLLDWPVGQINVVCDTDKYVTKETTIKADDQPLTRVQLTGSDSSYFNC